jgi:hypothetical protein
MSFSIHQAGLGLGILVLLIGSLVQTFEGIAGLSPPQVWGLLEYLVNTARAPRPANILEISGVPEETVRRLIDFSYDYALLVRR